METSKINEQIAHLSRVFADIILERGFLDSKIFPVNAYICVAFYQTYEKLYEVMSRVWKMITPEELARRSKRLLSPINALSITYLWLYYSLARMGVIYNKYGGNPSMEPAEKREQWRFMLEHWYRLATNYFDSGKPTVASSGKKNIALSEESLKWIKDHLQPVGIDQTVRARRAIGSIDLYAFLEECDARAKIVNHGPYPLGNEEILVISEYINLYDGRGRLWLPWSATEAKLPTSTLGIAMAIRGARATFNDIGTMSIEPADYSKLVTKMVAYTEKGGGIAEVPLEDLQAYAEAADRAHMELYMKFSQMDRKDLILAGATAYWRGFARYTDQVGITEEVDWNLSKNVLEEYLPYFLKNDEDPAFSRIKKKIIKMKALPFLKEKDPILYYLP
ncbi:MAG: hypothetical protein H5T34_05200 [Candidatus Methanomethyliales bacterium]|nr:hypothetical protein [Candidatus Methanomethylicales archaeon]